MAAQTYVWDHQSRAPHGARGLKFDVGFDRGIIISRAPHGARGLKYKDAVDAPFPAVVAPRKGRVD